MRRQRSGEGHKTISRVLKVPKSTVSSIIRKWKECGTSQTLPGAGSPTKLGKPGKKDLGQDMTNNPMTTPTELQSSLAEIGEPDRGQQSLLHFTNLGFMGEWPDGSYS